MKKKNNGFYEDIQEILCLANGFSDREKINSRADNFREEIEVAFKNFELSSIARKEDRQAIVEVRYALAAYIDELVLTSKWKCRLYWSEKSLQMKYFGEHVAGERFFSKLEVFLLADQKNRSVIEIYYVVLQLGFVGKYRNCEVELMELCLKLEGFLAFTKQPESINLFIKHEASGCSKQNRKQRAIILATCAILLMVIYSSMNIKLTSSANKIVQKEHRVLLNNE